jgi:hypothetical protein
MLLNWELGGRMRRWCVVGAFGLSCASAPPQQEIVSPQISPPAGPATHRDATHNVPTLDGSLADDGDAVTKASPSYLDAIKSCHPPDPRQPFPGGAMCPVWRSDVDAALADAQRDGRPALLVFYALWDGASAQMRRESFENPAVLADLVQHRSLVQVNATDYDDPDVKVVLTRFQVDGIPVLIFFSANGLQSDRVEQYMPAQAILKAASRD